MNIKHLFTVIIEKDKDGYYAYCPQLQGCYSQGATYEEAMENIKDAIHLHVEDRKEKKESWKKTESINVTSLELSL